MISCSWLTVSFFGPMNTYMDDSKTCQRIVTVLQSNCKVRFNHESDVCAGCLKGAFEFLARTVRPHAGRSGPIRIFWPGRSGRSGPTSDTCQISDTCQSGAGPGSDRRK